jgi:hypothetical protein
MPTPYAVDILKLIDFAQDALSHALTLQHMYEENLEPGEYDQVHAKHERPMGEKFQLLRASVENPAAFAKVVASLEKTGPKTRARAS